MITRKREKRKGENRKKEEKVCPSLCLFSILSFDIPSLLYISSFFPSLSFFSKSFLLSFLSISLFFSKSFLLSVFSIFFLLSISLFPSLFSSLSLSLSVFFLLSLSFLLYLFPSVPFLIFPFLCSGNQFCYRLPTPEERYQMFCNKLSEKREPGWKVEDNFDVQFFKG